MTAEQREQWDGYRDHQYTSAGWISRNMTPEQVEAWEREVRAKAERDAGPSLLEMMEPWQAYTQVDLARLWGVSKGSVGNYISQLRVRGVIASRPLGHKQPFIYWRTDGENREPTPPPEPKPDPATEAIYAERYGEVAKPRGPSCDGCGRVFDPTNVHRAAIEIVCNEYGNDPDRFCRPSCAVAKR